MSPLEVSGRPGIVVRRVSLVPLHLAPGEENLGITTGCGSPHEAGSTRQLDASGKVREEQNRRCMWGGYVIRGRGRSRDTTVFCPIIVLRAIDSDILCVSFVRYGLSEM